MYSGSTNVRGITAVAGLGIVDVPMLSAPDLQSIVGLTVFVAGLVVFLFLASVMVLAGYIYYVRAFGSIAPPEVEPVWLQSFDSSRIAEFDEMDDSPISVEASAA